MSFNVFIRKLHLVLGLASGLIIFIISLSGSLYVFKTEVSELLYHDRYFVKKQGTKTLPLSLLQQKAQQALGKDFPIANSTAYKDPLRAWAFGTYSYNPKAYTYFGQFLSLKTVFMDPYTGQVNGLMDNKYEFFMMVKMLHHSLWLRSSIGQKVIGWATVIFIVMLVSGVFLIFRKEKGKYVIRQRFTVKWKASVRRRNFDLHNVPGFYFFLLMLIMALTGLVIAFGPMWKLEYSIGNLAGKEKAVEHPLVIPDKLVDTLSLLSIDRAFTTARNVYSDAASIAVYPPFMQDTLLYIYPNYEAKTIYKFDQMVFNSTTGKPLTAVYYQEKNGGQKLNAMNYDIHAGSILGLPGKIMAFLTGLVAASLPLTGFIIWWGRRKR